MPQSSTRNVANSLTRPTHAIPSSELRVIISVLLCKPVQRENKCPVSPTVHKQRTKQTAPFPRTRLPAASSRTPRSIQKQEHHARLLTTLTEKPWQASLCSAPSIRTRRTSRVGPGPRRLSVSMHHLAMLHDCTSTGLSAAPALVHDIHAPHALDRSRARTLAARDTHTRARARTHAHAHTHTFTH